MANEISGHMSQLSSLFPAVKPTSPPSSLLRFPPASEPTTLPPPPDHPTLAHPFTIPANIYNGLLSANVPITIAIVYASVVTYLNSLNAQRKWRPWAFSQTRVFKILVIIHNIILAVYSAWTFIGMVNALAISFAGWRGEYGLAGAVDSLCKIHGPRGMGSAAVFNEQSKTWSIVNRAFHLAADGLGPERSDVGRIWNEGLAFYGWLFYLSKFYEVIDTAIILAKGKKSSFLQTYHHAGAMLGMWAGIRYMSPPIWMFVLVNSGIHTLMYTFYLCSVVNIKVPKRVKQTLTTMQITQFVVGASYAFGHLFVAYQVPVSVPYLYHLGDAFSTVASALPSDISSASSTAFASASADVGSWLKKAALRAAGREGLAENVINERGQTFGIDAREAAADLFRREETRFRDELQWEHCLDTSGQVFAILLNCMYLAPLTWLFVRFFIKAYLKRVERRRSSAASEKAIAARQSLHDASKGLARHVNEVIDEQRDTGDSAEKKEDTPQAPPPEPEPEPEPEPKPESESKETEPSSTEGASEAESATQEAAQDTTNRQEDGADMVVKDSPEEQSQSETHVDPDSGSADVDKQEEAVSVMPSIERGEELESPDEKNQRVEEESRKRFAAAQEALESLIDERGYDKMPERLTPDPDETSTDAEESRPQQSRELEDIEEQSWEGSSEQATEEPSAISAELPSTAAKVSEDDEDDTKADEELSFIAAPQSETYSPNDGGTGVDEATGPKEGIQPEEPEVHDSQKEADDLWKESSGVDSDGKAEESQKDDFNDHTSGDTNEAAVAGPKTSPSEGNMQDADEEPSQHTEGGADSRATDVDEPTSATDSAHSESATAPENQDASDKTKPEPEPTPEALGPPSYSESSQASVLGGHDEPVKEPEQDPEQERSSEAKTDNHTDQPDAETGEAPIESKASESATGSAKENESDRTRDEETECAEDDPSVSTSTEEPKTSTDDASEPLSPPTEDVEDLPQESPHDVAEQVEGESPNADHSHESQDSTAATELEATVESTPVADLHTETSDRQEGSESEEQVETSKEEHGHEHEHVHESSDEIPEEQTEQTQEHELKSEEANDQPTQHLQGVQVEERTDEGLFADETESAESAHPDSGSEQDQAPERPTDPTTAVTEESSEHPPESSLQEPEREERLTSDSKSTEDQDTNDPPTIAVPARLSQPPSIRSKTSSHSMRSSKSQLEQTAEELQAKNGDSPRHSSSNLVPTATA